MEIINSTPAGHKSRTCFTPITLKPPSFGAASNSVLRYPFPLSVKFAPTFFRANQRSVAKFESPLQPRTDETYKSKLGPVCFFQQAKFPWFSLRVSLTRHFVARSLDHPKLLLPRLPSCPPLHSSAPSPPRSGPSPAPLTKRPSTAPLTTLPRLAMLHTWALPL